MRLGDAVRRDQTVRHGAVRRARGRAQRCAIAFGVSLAWSSALGCDPRKTSMEAGQVDLRFVGDILLDSAPGRMIASGGDPFRHVGPLLAAADLAVGNLECPVATTGEKVEKVYTFRADPQTLPTLGRHLDVVSLANNHSGDYGPNALVETLDRLDRAQLPHFGAGHDLRQAHTAHSFTANGVRVALLGYDEFKPRSFEAATNAPGVAWGDDEQVLFDIMRERAAGADVVIPFFHWGWENTPTPTERQRDFSRRMIDAGAAAVVGCHPHVTQGAELYRGRPIIFSLGNFVFDLLDYPDNAIGWLLKLVVDRDGVKEWRTWSVDIDAEGVPTPQPSRRSPCGRRDQATIDECEGP